MEVIFALEAESSTFLSVCSGGAGPNAQSPMCKKIPRLNSSPEIDFEVGFHPWQAPLFGACIKH